jgi:hypothetical protein
MKLKINTIAATLMLQSACCWAADEHSISPAIHAAELNSPSSGMAASDNDTTGRADKRYAEMLDKMQAAVEEIAQLYGNPVFLQVFTNDEGQASELKQRLKAAGTGEDIRQQLTDLEKRRDALLGDIALRKIEIVRISGRLIRQRAALDALAMAVEQARRAVEDTDK